MGDSLHHAEIREGNMRNPELVLKHWTHEGNWEKPAFNTRENTTNAVEAEIVGLAGCVVIDNNDWQSDANGDGRVYPARFRILKVIGHGAFVEPPRLQWAVVDETGWDGFENVPNELVAAFSSYEGASLYRWALLKRSDPMAVFDAAVGLLNKEDGAFGRLKAAVDRFDR